MRDIVICQLVVLACQSWEDLRPTRNRAARRADSAPSGISLVVDALARAGIHRLAKGVPRPLNEASVQEHLWFGFAGELVRAACA